MYGHVVLSCVDVVVREMELGTLDGYVMLCCNVCWLGKCYMVNVMCGERWNRC